MKIKTKISYNCLEAICNLYDVVTEMHAVSPQEYHNEKNYKASIDIINLLFQKLKVTLVKKKKDCKPFSLSLEYFQAYYLVTFLFANKNYFTHEYYQSIVHLFAENLDRSI